jgi:hypothetical protein
MASGWAASAAMFTPTDCLCGTLYRILPTFLLHYGGPGQDHEDDHYCTCITGQALDRSGRDSTP